MGIMQRTRVQPDRTAEGGDSDMKLDELPLGTRRRARLVANEPLSGPDSAEEVRELVLDLEGDALELEAGQSIAVLIAGPLDFGQAHHVRLYSVASTPREAAGGRITVCVRRCSYTDSYSGERYPGIASNYLCDLPLGSELVIAGPVGLPFKVPANPQANLLMVGLGTGIAPFRALIRHIYRDRGGWQGKVRLFYGARTGLELVYMNDRRNDFAAYFDEATFEAIEALSPRPAWNEPADVAAAIARHRAEVWSMLDDPETHVYVAGLAAIGAQLDAALAELAGGEDAWLARKQQMRDEGRWTELLY
jgi:ferredoxin--NADP+ reductase